MITDELVNEVVNNGHTTKQLIARMHLENKLEHKELFTSLKFHSKFIWACIITLLTGFLGGVIAGIFQLIKTLGG